MFNHYSSAIHLKDLAKKPFDLTVPGQLTAERLKKFRIKACGYHLLYGTERITSEVVKTLCLLAEEAQVSKKMAAMQAGEVVNEIEGYPSEKRAVLHTATRDFFEQPNPSPEAKKATALAYKEIEKLKKFIHELEKEGEFTDLVTIGIGGSDLGPRAHYIALEHLRKGNKKVHFICNVDPDDAASVMRDLDLKKTLVVIVSKTGTTLETTANEAFVKDYFLKAKLSPANHFISISMSGSPLDDPTQYRACFHIWDWVGGRFSTTSMVGGLLLAFAFGFDVYWEFLKGANAMDKSVLQSDPMQNLPLFAALLGIWNRNFCHHATLAIIPYSQALLRFPAHIQQLDMESNGKRVDKQGIPVDYDTGPIIWGEPGTNAQHSFYQLIHQGTTIVPLEFIGFGESQMGQDLTFEGTTSQEKLLANLFAQMIALATGQTNDNPNKVFPGNRPSHLLLGEKLTPFALGVLLAFYEHKIAFQGFIWNINSFDQEGVQLGKVLANQIIERFVHPEGKAFPLADALLETL